MLDVWLGVVLTQLRGKTTARRIRGKRVQLGLVFFSGKAIAAHYDARFDALGLLVTISLPDLLTGTNVTGFCPGFSTGLGLTISAKEAAASTTAKQTSAEERCCIHLC